MGKLRIILACALLILAALELFVVRPHRPTPPAVALGSLSTQGHPTPETTLYLVTNIGTRTVCVTWAQVQTLVPVGWKALWQGSPRDVILVPPRKSLPVLSTGPYLNPGAVQLMGFGPDANVVGRETPANAQPYRLCVRYDVERTGLAALFQRLQIVWKTHHFPPRQTKMMAPSGQPVTCYLTQ